MVASTSERADWSGLRKDLRALEPGEVLTVFTPARMTSAKFRSVILVCGKRIFRNSEWAISTRTMKDRILCFLVPTVDNDSNPVDNQP